MAKNSSSVPPPPPPPSTASRVSTETVGRAVDALLKWIKSKAKHQKSQLLEYDEFIYLILTLKKIPPQARTNPYKIPLPHPLHSYDASEELCLIIDDRSKSALSTDSAKKKIQSDNIPISKVLKLSKLRSDYRPFEAKRKLCSSYDLFFADKRIIPLLPRLLGKEFFKKKKIPIPINLIHKNWKEQIQQACESALLYLRTGTCCVVKIGRISQGRDEIVENVFAAIDGVSEIIPKKWGNIRSLHLKSSESLALPVYQTLPDMGLKIEGVKMQEELKDEHGAESGEEEDRMEEKEKTLEKKKRGPKKGRIHEIRYIDGNLNELLGDDVDEKSENGELDNADLSGKKRKKTERPKKERVLSEVNGEKQLKKSGKAKIGNAVKQKKDSLSSECEAGEEADGDMSVSIELKKMKKTKIGKESGAMKMKNKKSKRI